MTGKQKHKVPTKPYEPTPRENKALSAFELRQGSGVPAPRITLKRRGNESHLSHDHKDKVTGYKLLMESLGIADPEFITIILDELSRLRIPGIAEPHTERSINSAIALAQGVRPQDEIEAMLAAQMAAVHMATMTTAARLTTASEALWIEMHGKALNKLSRTFAAQVDTLKRYRSKGEQKVTVEHVTVNEGGQAIVGSVMHGGRG
jgi:hypothetical protein